MYCVFSQVSGLPIRMYPISERRAPGKIAKMPNTIALPTPIIHPPLLFSIPFVFVIQPTIMLPNLRQSAQSSIRLAIFLHQFRTKGKGRLEFQRLTIQSATQVQQSEDACNHQSNCSKSEPLRQLRMSVCSSHPFLAI